MADGAGHAAIEATPWKPDSQGQLEFQQVEQPDRRHLAASLALDLDTPSPGYGIFCARAVLVPVRPGSRIEGALAVRQRHGRRAGAAGLPADLGSGHPEQGPLAQRVGRPLATGRHSGLLHGVVERARQGPVSHRSRRQGCVLENRLAKGGCLGEAHRLGDRVARTAATRSAPRPRPASCGRGSYGRRTWWESHRAPATSRWRSGERHRSSRAAVRRRGDSAPRIARESTTTSAAVSPLMVRMPREGGQSMSTAS